jgi:hypothetical protein
MSIFLYFFCVPHVDNYAIKIGLIINLFAEIMHLIDQTTLIINISCKIIEWKRRINGCKANDSKLSSGFREGKFWKS